MDRIQHIFEAQNLGIAPFAFVGMKELVHENGDGTTKAGGSCDSCGTSIRNACVIQDSTGRQFKVGTDCVEKTGDRGLINYTRREKAAVTRAKKADKNEAFIAKYEAQMMARIEGQVVNPHPFANHAAEGKTNRDYLLFCWENAGTTRRAALIKEWLGVKA